ncbi:hypothetical protein BJ999_004998 [Actinomadura citrea]|uniref:Uncharacterized protein n=1 Tax=Actinomadura citrea TaxID=46158 RepID=A0A7Y9GDW6_9ACTN|nr:hypothetical protein [Actinomadura citrea]
MPPYMAQHAVAPLVDAQNTVSPSSRGGGPLGRP